ncbi:carboxymuconolactone decarboxylase family protein [uncultured Fibrella sp.]|uniref:carboxymuconolactone decarboxylase family protein n=1 Tax=uncultured Fibrella sp. TaxID=1284596 RepID=UPI0035CC91B9
MTLSLKIVINVPGFPVTLSGVEGLCVSNTHKREATNQKHSMIPRIHPLPESDASAELKAAWAKHIDDYPGSRITNMKATLSHSPLAFDVYMQWYPLYHAVIGIVGERAAYLFAHAISEASNCPLCTTFFRKIIIQHGERPEDLHLTDDEQYLLDFGATIAQNRGTVLDETYEPIRQRFSDQEIVTLVAFAGQMIATNLINNVLHVTIDEYLYPYLPVIQSEGRTDTTHA